MTALASTAPRDEAEPRPSFRGVAWTALRVAVSVAALVTLYYVLPLDHASTPIAVTILLIGLAGFIVLVAYQVWLIIRSPFPGVAGRRVAGHERPVLLVAVCGHLSRTGRAVGEQLRRASDPHGRAVFHGHDVLHRGVR
jgi:hypothetical protein